MKIKLTNTVWLLTVFLFCCPARSVAQPGQGQLHEFPWSRMTTVINDVIVVKSKPVAGYVVTWDNIIHYGNIRLTLADGVISAIEIKHNKWRAFNLPEVVGLGRITSPLVLMHGGRNIKRDQEMNFRPLAIQLASGERLKVFGSTQPLLNGKSLLKYSTSLSTDIDVVRMDEVAAIEELDDLEMIRELYDVEANKQIKYGIIVGNTVQMAFDGVHREGLRIKPVIHTYEIAEHHLYEFSRAYYKGNNRYAGFMLGKGILEYLFPEEEVEINVPVFSLNKGPKSKGQFLLKLIMAADKSAFTSADYWVLCSYMNTYALYFHAKGKHMAARLFYEYALEQCNEQLPENNELELAIRHNYALLLFEVGEYWKSNQIIEEVLAKLTLYKGTNNANYLVMRNNRAMIMARLGQAASARNQVIETLLLANDLIPSYTIDMERIQVNAAMLAHQLGEYDQAMESYIKVLEALRIKEKVKLRDYDLVLLLQGSLYLEMATHNQIQEGALRQFLAALQLEMASEHSKNHSFYALGLMLEGRFLMLMKDYEKSLLVLQEANGIQGASLGKKSYDYLTSLHFISICYWKLGQLEMAEKTIREGAETYLVLKDELFSTMSENQRGQFWAHIKPHIDLFSLFAMENNKLHPEWLVPAIDFRIKTKGILSATSSGLRKAIMSGGDPHLISQFNEWVKLREELLVHYNTDITDRHNQDPLLEELIAAIDQLEKQLIGAVAFSTNDTPTFYDLAKSIDHDQAIIEIVKLEADRNYLNEPVYFAFVIHAGDTLPEIVSFSDGPLLDGAYYKRYFNNIIHQQQDIDSYECYWKPLEEVLTGIQEVYVINDGIYNQINLNSLKNREGSYLSDQIKINYLTNIRNFKHVNTNLSDGEASIPQAYLVGSPAFKSHKIIPLPGAARELQFIQQVLDSAGYSTTLFDQEMASEQNLKSIQGHAGILHLATHGYFFEKNQKKDQPLNSLMDRPDFRSGVLLAEAMDERPTYTKENDGFFSAYEALHLNLTGSQLVVLSACETGLGDLVVGESIQGLAHSFQVAGAPGVIMSLWKVDDEATTMLMTLFYKEWVRGNDLNSAFRQAQKQLRRYYQNPYHWGAFVLLQ